MQFALIGSGSKGNGTLVRYRKTCLLIDCGFSLKDSEARLQRLQQDPAGLTAILVTHEHGDHIRGVGLLARRYAIPVWTTRGTASSAQLGRIPELQLFDVHDTLSIGDIEIQPFPVPHDAREPCQFVFSDGNKRIGLLTDTGSTTPHIHAQLSGCDALILECNHDADMLANGPYPPSLKERVASRYGHLSNEQSASLLEKIATDKLQHLVAAHLSEQNNTPALAQDALSNALGCDSEDIQVACQEQGVTWCSV